MHNRDGYDFLQSVSIFYFKLFEYFIISILFLAFKY